MQETSGGTSVGPACTTRALLFLALVFVLFHVATLRVGLNGDSQSHLYLAASLAYSADFNLRDFEPMLVGGGHLPYFVVETEDGSLRSIFNFFPAVLLAPFFLVARFVVSGFEGNLLLWAYIASAVARLLLLGAGFALWFLVRPRYGTFPALMAVAALWFASSLGPSALDFMQHHPLVFFKLLALLLIFGPDGLLPNRWRAFAGGLVLACAVLSRYQALPSLAVLSLFVCYWNRHNRANLACFIAGGLSLLPAFFLYHYAAFGHPLRLGPTPYLGFNRPILSNLSALLLNPSKGLIVHSPWILFALAAPWFMLRRTANGSIDRLAVACFVSIFPTLMLHAKMDGWFGGWTWGPRYMSEIIPELTVLFALSLSRLGQQALPRLIACGLLFIGVVIATIGQLGTDNEWHARHDLGVGPHQDWLWQVRHNQIAYDFRKGDIHLVGGRRVSLWQSLYESHGLHHPETWGPISARWTGEHARFYFVPTSRPPTLRLLPNPSGREVVVTLRANGETQRRVLEPNTWTDIDFPGARFQRGVLIDLSVDPAYRETDEDGRILGVAIGMETGNVY